MRPRESAQCNDLLSQDLHKIYRKSVLLYRGLRWGVLLLVLTHCIERFGYRVLIGRTSQVDVKKGIAEYLRRSK